MAYGTCKFMLQINADAVKHPNTMYLLYLCVFFFFEMKKEGSSREEGRRQRKMVQGLYCTVVWKRHADACMALACREGVVYCSFAWWQKLKQGRQPFCCCCCVLQLSFFLSFQGGKRRAKAHATHGLSLSLSPQHLTLAFCGESYQNAATHEPATRHNGILQARQNMVLVGL